MGNKPTQITGDYHEAEKWILGSPLTQATQESLLRFIHKFPTLKYYKLKSAEAQPYPKWLRMISETLRGFMPNTLIWVQFDKMGPSSSRKLKLGDLWYHRMFTTEVSSEYERLFLGQHQLLVVYGWLETLESILAVKIGETDDQTVYEFDYGAIRANTEGDGIISQDAINIAFKSYTELLDHIVAIRLESGEIIRAKG